MKYEINLLTLGFYPNNQIPMIFSMTGYGKAESMVNGRQVVVELKSLNGKQFDIVNRLNPLLRKYESDIRTILQKQLNRGSVEATIVIKQEGGSSKPVIVNADLAKYYFNITQQIAHDLEISTQEDTMQLLATVMRMPEVVSADAEGVTDEEWEAIKANLEQASARLSEHRKSEGSGLENDLRQRIRNIENNLQLVAPFESQRVQKIKTRIAQNLEDWVGKDNVDNNRLEQEIVYYIEKNDISEEKQRLQSHCDYFDELISQDNSKGVGKKLGFVLQEIGREINTLGSKANDADIQKIVVNMKDELEKAKEQSLNVL